MNIVKKKILEAQTNADIAALYMLEAEATEKFDDETLGKYYANILELALENLTDALESGKTFDMQNAQDLSTLRALYEYAIEHYSMQKYEDASALFEILSGLSNDNDFSSAMDIHIEATKSKKSLEDFLDNVCDVDAVVKKGTFYLSEFK